MSSHNWKDNRKCKGCGMCLDIEEIKFENSCPSCGKTIHDDYDEFYG